MTKTTNKTARFTIDFINKQIIGTKASFSKASKGFGAEYEELTAKIAAHPDFELVIKEPKSKSTKAKRTYDGLDYKFMEAYISTKDDSDRLIKEYNAVKKRAVARGTKEYPLVKKWFLGEFSTEDVPFNMDDARKEIADFHIKMAKNSITATVADSEEQLENNPLDDSTSVENAA